MLCPPGSTGLLGGGQLGVTSSLFDLPVHASFKRQGLPSADGVPSSVCRDALKPLKVDTDLKKVITAHNFE
jgi:hypothetical protein